MKNLIVTNVQQLQSEKINKNGNEFAIKAIIPQEETRKCRANFVEVDPGNYAYGYHYHEANEEIFYIISGSGLVRTIDGEIRVSAGDVIGFPTGEKGAHVIKNESENEKLIYIDFGTTQLPEVVHIPDFNKIMVISQEVNGLFDKQ